MSDPTLIDLNLYENGRYRHRFNVYAQQGDTSRMPLPGYTARMEIRPGYEDDDPLTVSLTTVDTGGAHLEIDAAGSVDVVIPGPVIREDWAGQLYDLFIVSPTGARTPIAQGAILVTPSITRFPED